MGDTGPVLDSSLVDGSILAQLKLLGARHDHRDPIWPRKLFTMIRFSSHFNIIDF